MLSWWYRNCFPSLGFSAKIITNCFFRTPPKAESRKWILKQKTGKLSLTLSINVGFLSLLCSLNYNSFLFLSRAIQIIIKSTFMILRRLLNWFDGWDHVQVNILIYFELFYEIKWGWAMSHLIRSNFNFSH